MKMGMVTETAKEIKIELNPWQAKLAVGKQKYICLVNEFGSGKSFAGSIKAMNLSNDIERNNGVIIRNLHEDLRRNTAPLFFEYALDCTEDEISNKYNYNRSTKTLRFPNGSLINFIALDRPEDSKKIKNDVFGWVWLEQAEELAEEVFQAVVRRCRKHKDSDSNKVFLTANAEEGSWIYDYFFCKELNVTNEYVDTQYGKIKTNHGFWQGKNEKFLGIKAPPGFNKKNLPDDYYDDIVDTSPRDVVMRYVYNIAIGKGGAIYPFNDNCIVEENEYIEPYELTQFDKIFEAMDYGISETNPMVWLWGVRMLDGTIYIINEYYEHGKGIQKCCDYVNQINEIFPFKSQSRVGCPRTFQKEGTSNRKPADLFAENGISIAQFPVHFDVRQPIIEKLFEKGELKIYRRCTNLINELKKYKWKNIKTAENHAIEALERSVSRIVMTSSTSRMNKANENTLASKKQKRMAPHTAGLLDTQF